MTKGPEYLDPPGHQVRAEGFIGAANTLNGEYEDLKIAKLLGEKGHSDLAQDFLVRSDEIDKESARKTKVWARIQGKSVDRIRLAKTRLDKLAENHQGSVYNKGLLVNFGFVHDLVTIYVFEEREN